MWIALILEFVVVVIISLLWVNIISNENNNYDESD
jgi:hypothetical protein